MQVSLAFLHLHDALFDFLQPHCGDLNSEASGANAAHKFFACFGDMREKTSALASTTSLQFLQRVSIACYAERCKGHSKSVRLSVCPSVCLSVTRWH